MTRAFIAGVFVYGIRVRRLRVRIDRPNALDVLADVEWPEQPAELYEDVMMSAAVGEK